MRQTPWFPTWSSTVRTENWWWCSAESRCPIHRYHRVGSASRIHPHHRHRRCSPYHCHRRLLRACRHRHHRCHRRPRCPPTTHHRHRHRRRRPLTRKSCWTIRLHRHHRCCQMRSIQLRRHHHHRHRRNRRFRCPVRRCFLVLRCRDQSHVRNWSPFAQRHPNHRCSRYRRVQNHARHRWR